MRSQSASRISNQPSPHSKPRHIPVSSADRNRSAEETGMCRGFECGDGWFDILDALCERIQFTIDNDDVQQVVARQVKEKLGTLRFYITGGNAEIMGMIR